MPKQIFNQISYKMQFQLKRKKIQSRLFTDNHLKQNHSYMRCKKLNLNSTKIRAGVKKNKKNKKSISLW